MRAFRRLSFRDNTGRSTRGLGTGIPTSAKAESKGELPLVHGAGTGTGRRRNGGHPATVHEADAGSSEDVKPPIPGRRRKPRGSGKAKLLYGAGTNLSDRHIDQALDMMEDGQDSVGSGSVQSIDDALMGSANSLQSEASLTPTDMSFALAPGVNSVGGSSRFGANTPSQLGSVASGMTVGVGASTLQPQVFTLSGAVNGTPLAGSAMAGGHAAPGRGGGAANVVMSSRRDLRGTGTVTFNVSTATSGSGGGTPVAGAVADSPHSSSCGGTPKSQDGADRPPAPADGAASNTQR